MLFTVCGKREGLPWSIVSPRNVSLIVPVVCEISPGQGQTVSQTPLLHRLPSRSRSVKSCIMLSSYWCGTRFQRVIVYVL